LENIVAAKIVIFIQLENKNLFCWILHWKKYKKDTRSC